MLLIFKFSKCVIFLENVEYKCSYFKKEDSKIIWVLVESESPFLVLLSKVLMDEFRYCV